jgi:hypothetical protein
VLQYSKRLGHVKASRIQINLERCSVKLFDFAVPPSSYAFSGACWALEERLKVLRTCG